MIGLRFHVGFFFYKSRFRHDHSTTLFKGFMKWSIGVYRNVVIFVSEARMGIRFFFDHDKFSRTFDSAGFFHYIHIGFS